MKYYLGIDTGTTSVSIAAVNESREIIESITVNHEAFIPGDFPESRVQNPAKILSIVMAGLDSLTQKYGTPSAIGLTGQMHGILYLDSRGEPVSPLYTWQDSSANIPVSGKSSLDILRSHGLKCSSGYGVGTHFYLQRAGKIPSDAVRLSTISDYIAMKLCGNDCPVLSAEMAAGLGCFDGRERRFMFDRLESAGVDVSYLPETVRGYKVVGETEAGVPVVCSMGDNQASFMGSVDDPENTLLVNIGTGSQVSFMTRNFVDVSGDIELRPYGEAYILAGSALCGGRAYAMLEGFYREIAGRSCYDVMSRHAEGFLNSCGLSQAWDVDTRFNGTRSNPEITGSITGITADNFTPGAFTVGVMRGILTELHGMYQEMARLTGRRASVIVGSGNGLRKNEIMRRIAGEIFGLEVRLSKYQEEAARGCAMCAANVAGR
ncbi:MAG: hypothetical protein IJR63_00325 [Synergistaceae bacterium]|nr:hypothetical protein [Synergistaceae bacterium]